MPTKTTPKTDAAAPVEDGRRLRRERNRAAVVEAMLALYDEGNLAPSSDLIAERAGLSSRSLFRYFEDLDDLVREAIARQQQRVQPFLELHVSPDAPYAERAAAFVEQRLRLVDAMGTVGQIARMRAPFQPLIAGHLRQMRTYLRAQTATTFAQELKSLGSAASSAVAAIEVLCSYESHQLLHGDQGLSRPAIASTLTRSLGALLNKENR